MLSRSWVMGIWGLNIFIVLMREMKPLPVFRCCTAWIMSRLLNITHSITMNHGPVKALNMDFYTVPLNHSSVKSRRYRLAIAVFLPMLAKHFKGRINKEFVWVCCISWRTQKLLPGFTVLVLKLYCMNLNDRFL